MMFHTIVSKPGVQCQVGKSVHNVSTFASNECHDSPRGTPKAASNLDLMGSLPQVTTAGQDGEERGQSEITDARF